MFETILADMANPQTWLALVTLTVMEIVLGIDNIIFISILASRLPHDQQPRARQIGLAAALITRLILLASIAWLASLTTPLFTIFGLNISARDLILLAGGLFLIYKATHEIHERLEGGSAHEREIKAPSFSAVIMQIAILDIVFSLDSVITAIGMAQHLWVMVTAVIIAIGIMMFAATPISEFVNRHPTVKMLALSFLLLIGFTLVVESIHVHIPKGYIYFAMGFSIFVEMLNLRAKAKKEAPREPVVLHKRFEGETTAK